MNTIDIKSLHELDCYIGSDDPVTCPKCGLRTEFIEIANDKQQHKCKCSYEFFVDFEDDE